MQSVLLWQGRYRVTELRPEHMSSTCFVFKVLAYLLGLLVCRCGGLSGWMCEYCLFNHYCPTAPTTTNVASTTTALSIITAPTITQLSLQSLLPYCPYNYKALDEMRVDTSGEPMRVAVKLMRIQVPYGRE